MKTLLDVPTGKHTICVAWSIYYVELISLILLRMDSLTYPDAWDNPGISSIYLHETSSGCCDKFFGGNSEACSAIDVCAKEESVSITSTETTVAATTQLTDSTVSSAATLTPPHTTHPLETSTEIPDNDTSTVSTRTTATEVPACESGKWHLNEDSSRCTNR